jgi:hypothetical protein
MICLLMEITSLSFFYYDIFLSILKIGYRAYLGPKQRKNRSPGFTETKYALPILG